MIRDNFDQLNQCNDNNLTLEEFKACISNSTFALYLDKKDFDIDMDRNSIYQIINPKEGSIQFTESGTLILQLKSNNTYSVSFYDRNFMIRSNNPEVVPKNSITIKPNAYAFVYIKVN